MVPALHTAVFILQKSTDHLCTSVYGKYRRFKAEKYQCFKAILRGIVFSYVCLSLRTDRQGHQSPGTTVIYSSQLPFTEPGSSSCVTVSPGNSRHSPNTHYPRQLITLFWVFLCAFETKGNWTNLISKTPKTYCFGQLASIWASPLSKKGRYQPSVGYCKPRLPTLWGLSPPTSACHPPDLSLKRTRTGARPHPPQVPGFRFRPN